VGPWAWGRCLPDPRGRARRQPAVLPAHPASGGQPASGSIVQGPFSLHDNLHDEGQGSQAETKGKMESDPHHTRFLPPPPVSRCGYLCSQPAAVSGGCPVHTHTRGSSLLLLLSRPQILAPTPPRPAAGARHPASARSSSATPGPRMSPSSPQTACGYFFLIRRYKNF